MVAPDLDRFKEMFRAAPFIADLGADVDAVSEDGCTTSLLVQPRFQQQNGFVHAGVQATLADHSMGMAAYLFAQSGQAVLTVEFKMSLLRAAKGERLVCRAKVLKPGKQFVFTEAEVFCIANGKEQMTLKASATMAVVATS